MDEEDWITFRCVKELLLDFKKEVERHIEGLEVCQFYGARFIDSMRKPTRGDKVLVLENKEMGRMDVEVYGADMCKKSKGVGGSQSMDAEVDGENMSKNPK